MNHIQADIKIGDKIVAVDVGCVDMVRYFNSIGLDTKFSCQGGRLGAYEIMFQDHIGDKDIEDFVSKWVSKFNHSNLRGCFIKWCRVLDGELKYNWIYQVANDCLADIDLKTFENGLTNN